MPGPTKRLRAYVYLLGSLMRLGRNDDSVTPACDCLFYAFPWCVDGNTFNSNLKFRSASVLSEGDTRPHSLNSGTWVRSTRIRYRGACLRS
jgi:hypothetical protein